MTLPIAAIGAVPAPGTSPLSTSQAISPATSTTTAASVNGTGGGDSSNFATMLSNGINSVTDAQNTADSLAIKAATGDLTDIHDYTIAATQASVLTELATTVRTKAVDAFNQIMGMQA
jgi:flagellar hook-basal body complex protein FliE